MVRLSLIALPFLASLMGAAAQPPACSNIAVALKASKQVRNGDSTSATFSITNTGSTAMRGLIVGITLPPEYLAPNKMAVRPRTKPSAQAHYVAPSAVWTSITVPADKTLHFKVEAKTRMCNSYTTSLQINAAAYIVDRQWALKCYSGANPATVKVETTRHSIVPCPTPPPGPAGPVSLLAVDQAFAGASPQRRALTEGKRKLTASSLEACTVVCRETYTNPFYVVYNAETFACSCCQNACGALTMAPGSNVYQVLAPAPGTTSAPTTARTTAPTQVPTQRPPAPTLAPTQVATAQATLNHWDLMSLTPSPDVRPKYSNGTYMSGGIGILVYDGVNAMDALGPYQVLSTAGLRPMLVSVSRVQGTSQYKTEVTSNSGLKLTAHRTPSDTPFLDILIVTGGAWETAMLAQDDEVLEWIRSVDQQTYWTSSVCTGAWVLGATGLLCGKRATANWYRARELLIHFGALPVLDQRYVFDGKIVTAAGVTAGMDMALAMVQKLFAADLNDGRDYLQAVMLDLEYDPKPPIPGGSPSTTDPHVFEGMELMYDMVPMYYGEYYNTFADYVVAKIPLSACTQLPTTQPPSSSSPVVPTTASTQVPTTQHNHP